MRFPFNLLVSCILFGSLVSKPSDISEEAKLQGIVDDLINTTLSSLIAKLEDPLLLNSTYQRFNNVVLTGWVKVSDFALNGLRSIVANKINVTYKIIPPSSINLTISIQDLDLFLNYETSLLIGQILPYSGKGNISANLDSLNINVFTLADVVLFPTSIGGFKNASISFNVGKNTFFKIEGILNSDDISEAINEFLKEFLARFIDFLDSNQARISNVLSPVFQAILDKIFNNTTVA